MKGGQTFQVSGSNVSPKRSQQSSTADSTPRVRRISTSNVEQ